MLPIFSKCQNINNTKEKKSKSSTKNEIIVLQYRHGIHLKERHNRITESYIIYINIKSKKKLMKLLYQEAVAPQNHSDIENYGESYLNHQDQKVSKTEIFWLNWLTDGDKTAEV
ncbi:hypothetical protein AAHE18_18G114300 [Arachis hypogaea]